MERINDHDIFKEYGALKKNKSPFSCTDLLKKIKSEYDILYDFFLYERKPIHGS